MNFLISVTLILLNLYLLTRIFDYWAQFIAINLEQKLISPSSKSDDVIKQDMLAMQEKVVDLHGQGSNFKYKDNDVQSLRLSKENLGEDLGKVEFNNV